MDDDSQPFTLSISPYVDKRELALQTKIIISIVSERVAAATGREQEDAKFKEKTVHM
jgi:hypothetical protein